MKMDGDPGGKEQQGLTLKSALTRELLRTVMTKTDEFLSLSAATVAAQDISASYHPELYSALLHTGALTRKNE